MYQLGDEIQLEVTSTGEGLAYVWRWWDGTASVTTGTLVAKALNRAGSLTWDLSVIDRLGQKDEATGVVVVNAPPLFTGVILAPNDQTLPYYSHVTAVVEDDDLPITCELNGSAVVLVASPGTAEFDVLVSASVELALSGTDAAGGVASLPVEFRGQANRGPVVSSPSHLGALRAGSTGTLLVAAYDPEGTAVTFEWHLLSTGGWDSDQVLAGTTTVFGSAYQNVASVDLSTESSGVKTVILRVYDAAGLMTEVGFGVEVVANVAPAIVKLVQPSSARSGDLLVFSGSATDLDHDLLTYGWVFTGAVLGSPVTGTLPVATAIAGDPGVITGYLSVHDQYGGTATVDLSPITVA